MSTKKIWASLHPFYESGARLGRIEANRSFLQAFLELDPFDEYHFFLQHPADVSFLERALSEDFSVLFSAGRCKLRLRREAPCALANTFYHCMHLSDPFSSYSEAMVLRNCFSQRIFPLTAPTHSLSYSDYGAEFLKHLWPGATPRDAVVASSRAGLNVVASYYSELKTYYGQNNSPQVRHIPLGVNPGSMPGPENKNALAQKVRVKFSFGDDLIFLIFARISYQSKMDLLPVLRAFKRAESLGMNLASSRIVLAGWLDEDDNFAAEIQKLAKNLGIKCSLVARPDDETRKGLYAAADVFLSPSDNLQETFGLTMLEAAVSGLPIVASDFDGYKDLVEHGVSGFLIPSYGPDSTPETDALSVIVPASEYHLLLAQQCVVDVGLMGQAMATLATNAPLRFKMGEAGRRRVLSSYTWRSVVEKYIGLWDELNAVPCCLDGAPSARALKVRQHPMHPPFMNVFGRYFSQQLAGLLDSNQKVLWTKAGEAVYRGHDFPVVYRLIENRIDIAQLKKMLFKARKPILLSELLSLVQEWEGKVLRDTEFILLWALKHDLLELCEP